MRFKKYLLLEKTFNISKDVKYIYDKCFDPLVKEIYKHAWSKIGKTFDFNDTAVDKILSGKYRSFFSKIKDSNDVTYKIIDSSELPSKQAKESNTANPTEIHCGAYSYGNFYRPSETRKASGENVKKSLIQLSLHHNALRLVFRRELKYIDSSQLRSFYEEFKPARIKSTLAHEVSHWMNDTLHNFHITKLLKTTRELGKPEILKLHKKDVNMTHFEIDAQIHGLKQLKMQHRKDWDTLELKDIYLKYASLRFTAGQIYKEYGKEVGDIWQKMIVKRMAREKLLGKNMKKFAKYPEDFKN
jgi:hypothetical protein